MSSDLYEEALADAKQLKDVAERNAINAVTKSVAPKIRRLIEQELLGEELDPSLDDENILLDMTDDMGVPPAVGAATDSVHGISMPGADGKLTLDLDTLQVSGGEDDLILTTEASSALNKLTTDVLTETERVEAVKNTVGDKLNTLSKIEDPVKRLGVLNKLQESVQESYALIQESSTLTDDDRSSYNKVLEDLFESVRDVSASEKVSAMSNLFSQLKVRAGKMRTLNESHKFDNSAKSFYVKTCAELMYEAAKMYRAANQLKQTADVTSFKSDVKDLYEEIYKMSKKHGKMLVEEDLMLKLTLPDELELDTEDLSVEVVPEEGEGEVEDFEPAGDDLEGAEVDEIEPSDGDFAEEGHTYMTEMDVMLKLSGLPDEDDLDLGDIDVEVVPEEGEGEDEMDDEMDMSLPEPEGDEVPEDDVAEEGVGMFESDNGVYELDEADVKSYDQGSAGEAGLAKGSKFVTTKQGMWEADEEDGDELAELDELDELDEDTVVEIDESELREALQAMRAPRQRPRRRATNGGGSQISEARQALREADATIEDLRRQLAETNLFNAKLLYANKLLQNGDISPKQKLSIVESLDNAKSVREVKLLYKGLTESVLGGSKKKMNESKRRTRKAVGSASRPTRSASSQKLDENAQVQRWARLANIQSLND